MKNCLATVLLAMLAHVTETHAEPVKLTDRQIFEALSDRILTADNVEQIFQAGGQTIYIQDGNSSQGSWFIKGDQYCSTWPPSQQVSCFDVLQEGPTITFTGSTGNAYVMQVKPTAQ